MGEDVKTGAPVHVGLSGPKTVKVIVPVGFVPPARVAVSLIGDPIATLDVAVVVIVGVAGPPPETRMSMHQPPVKLKVPLATSSTTYRLQVPFGLPPLNVL